MLVNAAASFAATIQQQLEMLQSNPPPAEIAEKTIDHAEAKATYFQSVAGGVPELLKIATGKELGAQRSEVWQRTKGVYET